MTIEKITLFVILGLSMGMLIWGRLRYDLVAFSALLAAAASASSVACAPAGGGSRRPDARHPRGGLRPADT